MEFFYLFLLFFIPIALLLGGIKCFQRNPIVAILLLLFFFPGLLAWAAIECLTPEIRQAQHKRILEDELDN